MNYNICSIPSCDQKPIYICDCQAEKLVFCEKHQKTHSESSSLPHKFEYLYREPAKLTTLSILRSLQEEKSKIKDLKLKLFSEVSTNMKNLEEINKNGLKSLDSGIKIIDQFIRKILTTKEIRTNEEDPLLKILLLNNSDDAQLQLESLMCEKINYGDIGNSFSLTGMSQVDINRENDVRRINDLEKDVENLKNEVKRLSQIVENFRQNGSRNELPAVENLSQVASRNEIPVINSIDFSQSAYYEPARDYHTFQAKDQKVSSSQIYWTIGNDDLKNPIILLDSYQKQGFSDINDNTYLTSALQILASTVLFADLLKNTADETLTFLNILFSCMKRPSTQTFIDNLLSDFNITLAQNYPDFEKDPKNVINSLINQFYQYFPNREWFSSFLIQKAHCEAGHDFIKKDFVNIIELLSVTNKPISEEIDGNLNVAAEGFCSTCKQNKFLNSVVEGISMPSILILNLPIGNLYTLPEEFYYMESKYVIYGAIKCLYQQENVKKYVAYTKDENIWREYLDNISKIWQPDFSSCYLAFYIGSS